MASVASTSAFGHRVRPAYLTSSGSRLDYKAIAFASAWGFILVAHGGAGYQQFKPAVALGMAFLLFMSTVWLVQKRFEMGGVQLCILLSTVLLMYIPAITGLLSFGTTTGFVFLVSNVLVFLFFSQAVRRFADQSDRFICSIFILAATVSAILAVFLLVNPMQVGSLQFGREGYMRLVGPFSTPNRFGEVVALGTIAAAHVFSRYRERRVRYGLLAGLFLAATIASGSKGVILGLLFALVWMLILSSVWRKKFFVKAAALFLPVAGWLLYRYYELFLLVTKIDRIQEGEIDIGSGRSEIWRSGAEVFYSAPWSTQVFGHGTTGFLSIVGVDAHSTYWNLLFDNGIVSIGALTVLVACMCLLLVANRQDRRYMMLGTSLVVFCLVRGISMPTIFKEGNFAMVGFWAGIALIFCLTRYRSFIACPTRLSP